MPGQVTAASCALCECRNQMPAFVLMQPDPLCHQAQSSVRLTFQLMTCQLMWAWRA